MMNPALRRAARPALAGVPRRFLNLHEYQSKDLMEKFGVQVQRGQSATSAEAARRVAEEILSEAPDAELVVKAQIHAGGRGKGHFLSGFKGGVHLTTSAAEVEAMAAAMLGERLVTKQTGPEGQLCSTVLVNHGINIVDEKYFAILMDRAHGGPVIVASTEGGMDIEEVAERDPGAIITEPVDIRHGVTDAAAARVAAALGLGGALEAQAVANIKGLYALFAATDATQVEINPLAVSDDGRVYAVDAKLNFDDNAAYRQRDIFALRDKSMEDVRDVAAEEAGLNYIGLDGSIGCMVNGAGLAMATMDIIQQKGGSPANFLDVGGGATKEQVATAFKILTADSNVRAILVNIFGGIMKCDVISEGIVAAHREVGLDVPLVVRLEGTNVEAGRDILRASGLPIITADDLEDAAVKAVAAGAEVEMAA